MNLLYNAGIALFANGAALAAMRSPKIKKMIEGQKHTVPALEKACKEIAPNGFDVWFHAASLGEFEQARPIIERLKKSAPNTKILLSFFSPSGYEIRKNYTQADCVVYLPFDTPNRVKKFLDTAKPKMAIFAKYEFWGNYLEELHKRGIPTYIISSIFRPGQRFFKPWGGMFRKMLKCYKHLYVQDQNSADLLASIGVNNVTVAGDTRFDRVSDIQGTTKHIPEIEEFIGETKFTLIAGSSWPEDEDRYIPWLKANPEVKAIIAPHEFDPARLDTLREKLGKSSTVLFSEIKGGNTGALKTARHIIIDCFGLLSSLYRYGSVAVIGGGFGAGIHNLNEAAVYGMPVVFGPNHKKFKEASDLIKCGGGFSYSSASDLNAIMDSFLHHIDTLSLAGASAGKYIESNLGASDKIFADIFGNNNK